MDSELSAMQISAEALGDLDPKARLRVVLWLISKYDLSLPRAAGSIVEDTADFESRRTPNDFADLFFKVSPQGHAQRALVAAYWLAGRTGETFSGQAINSILKDLGFQIPNITDALSQSMREKPALVIQVKKGGNSQQARKSYKITEAGVRQIERLIDSNSTNEES